MPFNYYHRLSRRQQSTYRRSDEISEVALSDPGQMRVEVENIERGLRTESREAVQQGSERLATLLSGQLGIPKTVVNVLARRPSDAWGELHGLYEPAEPPAVAQITVWMRTAKRKQVVAFKTYLRTLLHEIGHHLDYEYFRLEESFHTEGFYKRENHMFHILTQTAAYVEPVQQRLFPDG